MYDIKDDRIQSGTINVLQVPMRPGIPDKVIIMLEIWNVAFKLIITNKIKYHIKDNPKN